MKLYYHKTDGGAEYLTDTFIEWEYRGEIVREGTIRDAKYVIRIDGDITKDAELMIREDKTLEESRGEARFNGLGQPRGN